MKKKRNENFLLGIIVLLLVISTSPVFAEVTSLKVNSDSFFKGDQIKFSGSVEKNSVGLVTIVIRDQNNKFVQLNQATINYDNTFEKTIKINENFSEHGVYNATGFILNMTKGVTANFGVSLNGVPIILENTLVEIEDTAEEEIAIQEKNESEERNMEEAIPVIKTPDFVDPNKDPQYYIDRYYNEPSYKSWFDRNYPELTIEDAVMRDNQIKTIYQIFSDKEIIPEADASSIMHNTTQTKSSEIAEISLAIAGLGILFGAVIGIKKKVENNSKHLSLNKNMIKNKFIHQIIGKSPKEIIQMRLAKGEITLEEYDKLKSKLG